MEIHAKLILLDFLSGPLTQFPAFPLYHQTVGQSLAQPWI